MYIMLVIALLLTPGDSTLASVEECRNENGLVTKLVHCHEVLVELQDTPLFVELSLLEVEPTLDTLVVLRDSIHTLLKERGIGWFGRRYFDWRAYRISRQIGPLWGKLEKDPNNLLLREQIVDLLGSAVSLVDEIRDACPTCPADV